MFYSRRTILKATTFGVRYHLCSYHCTAPVLDHHISTSHLACPIRLQLLKLKQHLFRIPALAKFSVTSYHRSPIIGQCP